MTMTLPPMATGGGLRLHRRLHHSSAVHGRLLGGRRGGRCG
jgi:hypothetical protein